MFITITVFYLYIKYFLFIKEINWCNPQPCLNGGKCQNYGSFYKCICPKGYTGKNCEKSNPTLILFIYFMKFILFLIKEINWCKPQPCLNGGTCQNYGSSYNCLCPKGFTGANCEKSSLSF